MSIPYKTQAVTTYIGGKGVDISPSNEIRIGQVVGTTNDVVFNKVTSETIHVAENVGIGTNSPTEALDVIGNIQVANKILGTSDTLLLYTSTTGPNSYGFLEMGPTITSLGSPEFRVLTGSNNASAGNESLRILSNGNVGIGTDNPTQKLEVNGTIKSGSQFYVNDILHERYTPSAYEIKPNLGWSDSFNSRGLLSMNQYNASIQTINSTGGVISGVSAYKDGQIYITGSVQASGSMGTNQFEFKAGNVGQRVTIASTYEHIQLYSLPNKNIFHWAPFQQVSDDRLKWEETPLTDGLDVIMTLKPVSYWKGQTIDVEPAEEERRWEIGLIAQEVEKIPQLKHCVSYNESTPDHPERASYTLNYAEIHNYHLAATQELYKKMEGLVQTITELNERINVLER